MPKCTFDGMCSMNQALYALYESGRITEETAWKCPQAERNGSAAEGRI
jgi:twitching motility protein PilT